MDGSFKPFRKPNNTPLYINTLSNHPPNIIKNLPDMINKRLSHLSSSKHVFDEAKPEYEKALQKSGYNAKLSYTPDGSINETKTRKRRRCITWYNPPYSANVKTDIGRKFFALLDKHFPASHRLSKIINRNTIKLSYSSMPNIAQIIQSHNKTVLDSKKCPTKKSCNCKNKLECPLNGECLKDSNVYKADLETSREVFPYIGITEPPFKVRLGNHTKSFNHEKYRHNTELSKKVWELKEKKIDFKISWHLIQHAISYRGGGKTCDLCTSEKLHIIKTPNALNKNSEFLSKCRHRQKFLLSRVTDAVT